MASKENNILIYEMKDENHYEIQQSLNSHDKKIYSLAELDNGNLVS